MKIAYGRSSWIKILSTFQTFSGKIFRCKTLSWSFVRLSSLPFLSTLDGSTRWICRDGGGFARSRFYYRKSARWYKQHPSRRVVNRTDHACTARGHGSPTRRHELSRLGRFQWPGGWFMSRNLPVQPPTIPPLPSLNLKKHPCTE